MKKLTALILTLIFCISLFPATVSAEDAPTSGSCGENVTWTFDAATGTLTIEGEGAMEEFYTAPWQAHAEAITTAVIGEGVTSVSGNAFYDCTALASVQLPESLTSIGVSAFYGCSALTEISIPTAVSSIGMHAFGSSGLTSFEFPPLVTRISNGMLANCVNLTSIHIPEQITAIDNYAFQGCTSLAEVTGAANVVETGEHIFDEAPLDAHGDFIIFGSTLVDYVGEGGEVVIPDGVTYVHGSVFFNEHDTVTSVVFPEGVETIKLGTFNSTKVTSVTLPASLKTIEGGAFYACMTIKDVYYAGTPEQWSAITVGYQNDNLLTADIHFSDDTSANISEPEPPAGIVRWSFDEETGVMTVSGSAEMEDFWYRTDPGRPGCELVTELVIEDGVQSIGDYAFAGFSQITSVTIPDSVTSIGEGAFAGCTSLETIYVGSSVTEMNPGMFSHVSDFFPEKAERIRAIYVDEDNPAFADIDGVLFSKDLRTLVYYPRGREAAHYNVPNGVTTIGAGAFNYNMWEAQYTPAIKTVSLPASVTEIGTYAFGEGISYEYREEPSAWAQPEVDEAIALGLVPPDLQRSYGSGVTREEYCRFVVELIESVSGKSAADFLAERSVSLDDVYFTDTDAEHVRIAGALGVVQGVGDGRFDPDTALTREAAATMLARLAALFAEVDALPYVYDDAPQIASWARSSVYAMRALGVMQGDNMNRFEPDATYTREAAILTIVRMHKALTGGVERTQQYYPMLAEVDGEYLWGCVDESGAFVIEPQYAYLDWSGDYGIAALPDAPNEYFVIDRAGEFVMAAEGHHEERIPKIIGNLLHIDMWGSELLYRLPDGEHVYGAMQKSRTGGTLNSGYVTVFDDMNKWAGMLDRDGKTVISTDEHWTFCGTPFDGKVILGKGDPDEYYLWEDGKITPLPALTGSCIMNDSVGDLYRLELSWLNEDFEFEYLYGLNTVYGEILPLECADIELTKLGQAFTRRDDASPWELWSRAGKLCDLPDGFAGEFITDRIAHYAFALGGEVCIVSTEGVETARVALPEGASFEFANGLLRVTTASESAYYTPQGEVFFSE